MPDASIHSFNGWDIQEISVRPSNTRRSSSYGRSPHSCNACAVTGLQSSFFVFCCTTTACHVPLLVCRICFHFNGFMSLWRKPVRIENRNARFRTSSLQGVSTNICTSFMVRATRGFSIELIPFTFALMSTVRYSSIKACFSPALTIEK